MASPQNESASSVVTRPLCTICNQRYSIYTCPRCSAQTCSFPCSSAHKSRDTCSGERDKAAYVPMNQYGWGTMMNDYAYLEDIGRRVADWGGEIVRGKFAMKGADATRGQRHERGRGIGITRDRGNGRGNAKRDVLKLQLESRDIDMDLLPAGMERRKVNQSCWDFRNHRALLTIEFKFHPPLNPRAPASQPQNPPFSLLTHRNSLEKPLLTLIQAHVTERNKSKKDTALPVWVKPLVCADPDDPDSFTPPQCVMAAQLDRMSLVFSGSRVKEGYYMLDPTRTLAVLLQQTYFVEFPTIEVWDEFHGVTMDKQGAITHYEEEDRRPKRRKMDAKAGKKTISGLLGAYGSDEEEEEEKEDSQNVLAQLGGYTGTDDDSGEESGSDGIKDDLGDEEAERETDGEVEVNPAALLELMRQVQGNEIWKGEASENDLVDWGNSDEDEPNL